MSMGCGSNGFVRNLEQSLAHRRLSNPKEAKADLGVQIPILIVLYDLGDSVPVSGPLASLLPSPAKWDGWTRDSLGFLSSSDEPRHHLQPSRGS